MREKGIKLMSQVISKELGIPCAVLSGANIATEIAMEKFSESTIGRFLSIYRGVEWDRIQVSRECSRVQEIV